MEISPGSGSLSIALPRAGDEGMTFCGRICLSASQDGGLLQGYLTEPVMYVFIQLHGLVIPCSSLCINSILMATHLQGYKKQMGS